MAYDCYDKEDKKHSKRVIHKTVSWGFPSFVAFVGAAVYFIQQTNGGFWVVIVALLKACVWPAYVVYHLLQVFGA